MPGTENVFTGKSLEGLGEPVRRYLDHVLSEGTPLVGGWAVEMKGSIRVGLKLPFDAWQTLDGSQFTWRAKVPSSRLGLLEVIDSYADGQGGMTGRIFGRKAFSDTGPDAARSAATRAVMESTMAPATLLTGTGVSWQVISDHEICFRRPEVPLAEPVTIRIDDSGRPLEVEAPRWLKEKGDEGALVPFLCRFTGELKLDRMIVPETMVAGWRRPDFEPFFEARITRVEASPPQR